MNTKKEGAQTLLAGKEYIPANQTDVQATWRRFGWQPTHQRVPQGTDLTYKSKGKTA